jgi:integrase
MGMDLNSVADQLGHASIQMLVNDYAHNARNKSKETATYMENALMPKKPSENNLAE